MLDVGCGVGTTAIEIARRFRAHVTVIDISPLMLDRIRANVHAAGLEDRVTVEQGVRPITDYSAEGDSQMGKTLSPTTRRRLDVQGFSDVNDATLAEMQKFRRDVLSLSS